MRKVLAFAVLMGCAAVAAAQTAYVTDSLRLGLHHESDTSGRAFDNLVSGTAIEILERVPNFARVRTPDGQEGWVKSAYLVEQKPAALRVAELEAQIASLRDEVRAAGKARESAEAQLDQLRRELAASTGSTETIQETLGRLKSENQAYESRLETYRRSLPWPWVAAALVVAAVAGFAGGLWWLDALIRRRHGGFRIY